MTKDQQTQLLGAVGGLCRALGADLQPDAQPAKQVLYGLAFYVGRFLKTPDHARALALLARDYMPAPEPTAAPAELLDRITERGHHAEAEE